MLIDVRTKEEYDEKHVDGAVNLPVQDIQNQSQVYIDFVQNTPKDTVLHVHCASGGRSMIACVFLKQLGYLNVINIGGYAEACECAKQ